MDSRDAQPKPQAIWKQSTPLFLCNAIPLPMAVGSPIYYNMHLNELAPRLNNIPVLCVTGNECSDDLLHFCYGLHSTL